MNNKRKNNSLLSYFSKSTKSVVNSDPNEPQPAPSQSKDTETVDLVSKNSIFDYLIYLSLLVSTLWVSINNTML